VTIAIRPSKWGETAVDIEVIWVSAKEKYFCEQDWTAQISLNRLNNFAVARKSPGRSSRLPNRRWRDALAAGAGFDLPDGSAPRTGRPTRGAPSGKVDY